jgi:hypothetical protein
MVPTRFLQGNCRQVLAKAHWERFAELVVNTGADDMGTGSTEVIKTAGSSIFVDSEVLTAVPYYFGRGRVIHC